MMNELRLQVGVLLRTSILARLESGRFLFQLPKGSEARLFRQLGPDLATRWAVVQHVRWFLPLGLLFLLTSVAIGGPDPVPFDVLGAALGVGLLAMAAIARVLPRAWLLLGDALWLVILAGRGVSQVATGASHWGWLLLNVWLVMMAVSAVKTYRALPGR